ncbi:hypothetical protein [Demequina gelatinilytica]|uniref:hypothetical protein n=1 Tax=Demequina gelatinilytica TaxID=1638980 RepID=UPI000783332E|nr:hypothetical protein [Demequina gelatinilytica]
MRGHVAAAALAAVLAAGVAGPASANSDPTVDRAEYEAVQIDDTLSSVQALFDGPGRRTDEFVDIVDVKAGVEKQSRTWRVAGTTRSEPAVDVVFAHTRGAWRVVAKFALWRMGPRASADDLTRAEYRLITKGMTLAAMHDVTGGSETWTDSAKVRGKAASRTYMWRAPAAASGFVVVELKWRDGAYRVDHKTDWNGSLGD